jgi:hypothetical protein
VITNYSNNTTFVHVASLVYTFCPVVQPMETCTNLGCLGWIGSGCDAVIFLVKDGGLEERLSARVVVLNK